MTGPWSEPVSAERSVAAPLDTVVHCRECGGRPLNQGRGRAGVKRGQEKARRHVAETGHTVDVYRHSVTTYRPPS